MRRIRRNRATPSIDPSKLRLAKMLVTPMEYGPSLYQPRGNVSIEYVGTVINPKTLKPYFVVKDSEQKDIPTAVIVPSTTSDMVLMGNGYMEPPSGAERWYCIPSKHFGLPRAHTPGGVAFQGQGLGTCLYVALAACATYTHRLCDPVVEPVPAFSGDGVCSGYGASDEALKWWRSAVDHGLADFALWRAPKGKGTAEEIGESANKHFGFALRFEVVAKKRLVMDLNPTLMEALGWVPDDLGRLKGGVLESILHANLEEVFDPAVLLFFYALAFQHGASFDEVVAMRNRTEGTRAEAMTDTKTLEKVSPHDLLFADKTRKVAYEPLRRLVKNPVVRQNPPPDFEEIAADLYPDLAGLDD